MTTKTTSNTPSATVQAAPKPSKGLDWRQLDFAADGLVLRSGQDAKR
jgi:hypothetical protein